MSDLSEADLRELDARVHREVMGRPCRFVAAEPMVAGPDPDAPLGWSTNCGGAVFTADREWLVDDWYDPDANREVPRYSTDIAAAWEVVGWLRERFGQFQLVAGVEWHCWAEHMDPWGSGDTAPLAICRAALAARPAPG